MTRTQEGKAYARRHNPHFREGRKETYSDMEILAAYQQHQNGLSYQQVAKKTGISASTLKRRIKKIRQAEQNR